MKAFCACLLIVLAWAIPAMLVEQVSHATEPADSSKEFSQNVDEQAAATDEETLEHVPIIVKVEHAIQTSEPPNLLITAYGKVPTGGWRQVQLIRRIYVNPPADGIWEYDLLALRPQGPVTQVETIVRARNQWKDYDRNIKGVRVYGIGRGAKEIPLK